MIFLIDENISWRLARMLDQFDQEHEVRALRDYFEAGTPDIEWMKVFASRKGDPVAVAGDGRILKNKVERQALKECALMFVCLAPGWMKLPWEVFAWKMVKAWPDIVRNANDARQPTLFEVSTHGKVRVLARISNL